MIDAGALAKPATSGFIALVPLTGGGFAIIWALLARSVGLVLAEAVAR